MPVWGRFSVPPSDEPHIPRWSPTYITVRWRFIERQKDVRCDHELFEGFSCTLNSTVSLEWLQAHRTHVCTSCSVPPDLLTASLTHLATAVEGKRWFAPTGRFNLWWAWESVTSRECRRASRPGGAAAPPLEPAAGAHAQSAPATQNTFWFSPLRRRVEFAS